MSEQHLHIISFDVPYPPDYGGVIDVFYKIKALHDKGVAVHLHCYDYGRGQQDKLNDICAEVTYYQRNKPLLSLLSARPYIVQSRANETLLSNLLADNYPILCEGLHTAFVLDDARFATRHVYVRTHNVEHDYYKSLSKSEKNLWKRLFFETEWRKLRRYEKILSKADKIFAISQSDNEHFSRLNDNVCLVPIFNSFAEVSSPTGHGSYVLYHGNLSVSENYKAAEWLLLEVFSKLDVDCVIAGHKPPASLVRAAARYSNVTLKQNPSDEEMKHLIANAHANVLVTKQATGMKLKLLNALYNGRHCVVNSAMLSGTGLDTLCVIADVGNDMVNAINAVLKQPFTIDDVERRRSLLMGSYSDSSNANKLIGTMKWKS